MKYLLINGNNDMMAVASIYEQQLRLLQQKHVPFNMDDYIIRKGVGYVIPEKGIDMYKARLKGYRLLKKLTGGEENGNK